MTEAPSAPLLPGVTPSEAWTPDRVRQSQEAAAAPQQMIVLHFQWGFAEGGTATQETYGPWVADDDESYLEQISSFIRDWHRVSGCKASSVTMALVQDPAIWLAGRG